MKSVEDRIRARIRRAPSGWIMTNRDFADCGSSDAVDVALFRLKKNSVIRGLARGLFDKPVFNELLGEFLAPDVRAVAEAVARKNQWHVQPAGALALNALGLDTQVPVRPVFLSDGPTKTFRLYDGTNLRFRHRTLRESKFRDGRSEILVQALKEAGDLSDPRIADAVRRFVPPPDRAAILADTRFAPAVVHDFLKRAFSGT